MVALATMFLKPKFRNQKSESNPNDQNPNAETKQKLGCKMTTEEKMMALLQRFKLFAAFGAPLAQPSNSAEYEIQNDGHAEPENEAEPKCDYDRNPTAFWRQLHELELYQANSDFGLGVSFGFLVSGFGF